MCYRALTLFKKKEKKGAVFLLSLFFGEQTTHEWGQMTVTVSKMAVAGPSDQSFDWPDAADVVSAGICASVCVCVGERKTEIIMLLFI